MPKIGDGETVELLVTDQNTDTSEESEPGLVGMQSPCTYCGAALSSIKRCIVCGMGECLFCTCKRKGRTDDQLQQQNGWICTLCQGKVFKDICEDQAAIFYLKTQEFPLD